MQKIPPEQIGMGLLPLPPDGRDFKITKLLGQIDLAEMPDEFVLDGANDIKVKNQGPTDYCTAYAGTSASELQEIVELSPLYQFAKTKEIMGDADSWGADLRSMCKSLTQFGSLEEADMPQDITGDPKNFRDWSIWPAEADGKAQKHLKKSYFEANGYDSTFDAIKAALWQNRAKKRAIIVGAMWRPEWTKAEGGIIPENYGSAGYGHAFIIVGWKNDMLIAHLSNGEEIGDKGKFYFKRDIANKELGNYGKFLLVDIEPEEAKKKVWSIRRRILEWLRKKFK